MDRMESITGLETPSNDVGGISKKVAPWESTHSTGAQFLVQTQLKESTLPGAGLGRFASSALPAGQIIRYGSLVPVASYLASDGLEPLCGIQVSGEEDLEALVQCWSETSGDQRQCRERLVDFLTGVRAQDTDSGRPVMYLGSSAAFINHEAELANVQVFVEKGVARLVTTKHIHAGEELFLDYRLMYISSDIKLYCARHGLCDVHSMSMQLTELSTSIPAGGMELRELGVHEEHFENQILAGYCKLQTEVYSMSEVYEEKILVVRQLMARILAGSLPGKIYFVGDEVTGVLGYGIMFQTYHQAVSPDGSYADEKLPYLWIHSIYVQRNARKAGISSLLLEAAESCAEELGCVALRADVACHNDSIARLLRGRAYCPETTVWLKSVSKL